MLGSRFSSGKLEVVSMEGWMSNEQVVERMKRVRRLGRASEGGLILEGAKDWGVEGGKDKVIETYCFYLCPVSIALVLSFLELISLKTDFKRRALK